MSGQSAVYDDCLSGDIPGVIRGEKGNGSCHIFRFTQKMCIRDSLTGDNGQFGNGSFRECINDFRAVADDTVIFLRVSRKEARNIFESNEALPDFLGCRLSWTRISIIIGE